MIVSESCISLNKTTTYKFGKKGNITEAAVNQWNTDGEL